MKKLIIALLLVTVSFAFADSGITVYNEDVSSGTCEPLISQGFEDVVSWTQLPNAPTGFIRATSCVIGDWYYTWGDQNTPTSQAYNVNTGTWAAGTPPPFGNCNVDGVAANGSFYQVCTYSGSYGNQVQKFTPTGGGPTGTWTQMAPYPLTSCGISVAWDGDDNIYAAGGGTSSPYDQAYVYSISANTWTQIASMPGAMKYAGGAFCGGEFHIVGGVVSPYNIHYAYNPVSNTWSTKATPPSPPSFGLFSTVNDDDMSYMYIVGGGGGYGSWVAINDAQIYDPGTDSWTLDSPWPVTGIGLNAVAYAGEGVIYSAGGYPGTVSTAYMGEGFPYGIPTPLDVEVDVTLTSGSPVSAGGGEVDFNIVITNNELITAMPDVWTDVTLPSGTVVGPLINVPNVSMAAGLVIERDRVQYIPPHAPAGAYTYDAYVGNYPSQIWDTSSFSFTKSAGDAGSGSLEGWACWGEPFEELQAAVVPETHNLLSAYPNPFNPETTVSFTLENSANVKLAVYDIQGREVARLANGWISAGSHDRTFNAVDLSSGVYFVSLTTGSSVQTLKMLLVK